VYLKAIQFTEPWKPELIETDRDLKGARIIENAYSIISAGTELAVLSGGESWAALPFIPGYGSVGQVIEDPDGIFSPGEWVFTYGTHSKVTRADTLTISLSTSIDPKQAVFARMAAVSITALRCSSIELGDRVAVIGAGIVGNLAAQLVRMAGADVTIIDPSVSRREAAVKCRIPRAFPGIADIAGDENFSTVIEATGIPSVVFEASALTGSQGELILLGSPRGSYTSDVTSFLNKIHLCPTCMTVKGAHEWRYPVRKDSTGMYKHSIERNIEIILEAIESGDLLIEPLITHVVRPEEAPAVYLHLRERDDDYLGVLISWMEGEQ
jgi:2-desacetyl-2-hydroxyethyl bacteriochlorophyllide A dehydrogenase